MGDRSAFRRGLREIHGDAEIVELGAADEPVRRYVVLKPEPKPSLTKVVLAIAALPFLFVGLMIGLGLVAFGLFMLWVLFGPK